MDRYSLRLDNETKAVIRTALNQYYVIAPRYLKDDVRPLALDMNLSKIDFSYDEDQKDIIVDALRAFREHYLRDYAHINRDIKRRCTIAFNVLQRIQITDFERRMSNPRFQPCKP